VFSVTKINKMCNRQCSKITLIPFIQVQTGAELPNIPHYQKSPSCVGSGSLGSCSIFSGVFIAEEIDGVGDMG
jgi:hypothetical protein